MSQARYASFLLVVCGMVALGAGGAMVLLKWHPTLGYGGLGAGVLLTLAGVAAGGRSPAGALSQRISRPLGALRLPGGKRTRAIVVATIIVGATLGTFLYGEYQLSSQSGSQFGLSLNVDSASEVTYPDGSVGVTVHVAAVGGIPPYTYTAVWGDNTDQTSTAGNFTRVFGAAFPVSTGLAITAKSSNSGLGYLFLSLPAQAPVISGIASTRTLTIVPSNGAQGSQGGASAVSTQTKETDTFIAVVNASTPTVAATTASVSTASASSSTSSGNGSATPPSEGFEVVVIVRGTSGQPIEGATVSIDGTTTQSTPVNGTVFFFGISEGVHNFVITYGTWSTTISYIAEGNPTVRLYVNVPGQ